MQWAHLHILAAPPGEIMGPSNWIDISSSKWNRPTPMHWQCQPYPKQINWQQQAENDIQESSGPTWSYWQQHIPMSLHGPMKWYWQHLLNYYWAHARPLAVPYCIVTVGPLIIFNTFNQWAYSKVVTIFMCFQLMGQHRLSQHHWSNCSMGFTNYYNKHLHHYVEDDVLNRLYERHSWSTFRKIHHAGVLNNPTNIVSKEPQSRTTFKQGCKWERTQVMRRDSEAAISSH